MPENITNELLLEHLKCIQNDLTALKTDMLEVKQRLGALEEGQASLSRRIERRLDLADSPAE